MQLMICLQCIDTFAMVTRQVHRFCPIARLGPMTVDSYEAVTRQQLIPEFIVGGEVGSCIVVPKL